MLQKELARREARDQQFREEKDPIPADKRNVLLPLRYYPPDASYTVAAALRLGQERPVVLMPTSTGTIRKYERVGVLEFTFQGQSLSLGAFIEAGTREIEGLFVPFVDATSGKETYPAGRYLDIPPTTTGLYEIDFNKAYNPYCAYNATLRVPVSTTIEPAEGRNPRRRKGPGRMSRALQAIVFDFDGVIANSEPLHLTAFQQALAAEGVELSPADYFARYLGYDDVGLFEALARDRGIAMSGDAVRALVVRKGERMQDLLRSGSVVFPGATEFIREAAAAVPIAIASGAMRHEIDEVIDAAGITDLFSTIVAAGDTPQSKPSPAPYRLALERLRESSGRAIDARRSVAIEDSRWGLESAHGAGLRLVGVTNSYPAHELAGAELVVEGLQSLTLPALDRLCAR